MFSWMLALKLTRFQIFVCVRLDNNQPLKYFDVKLPKLPGSKAWAKIGRLMGKKSIFENFNRKIL
jgi:hypothetical protein